MIELVSRSMGFVFDSLSIALKAIRSARVRFSYVMIMLPCRDDVSAKTVCLRAVSPQFLSMEKRLSIRELVSRIWKQARSRT